MENKLNLRQNVSIPFYILAVMILALSDLVSGKDVTRLIMKATDEESNKD